MESILENIYQFFVLFYSTPVALYSVPFTVFFAMLILSTAGLQIDFNMDGEANFDSAFLKGFFTHFHAVKIPFTLFMVLFFMGGSIFTTIFVENVTDDTLWVSIFMVAIIYPLLWFAIIPLTSLGSVLDNTVEPHKVEYVGSLAKVSSVTVSEKFGYAACEKNGVDNQIDICTYEKEGVINRGDIVFISYYDKDKKRYVVEKENS